MLYSKKTIAFLYNIRRIYPDPQNDNSQLDVDADDPDTIEHMTNHLKNLGHHIIPIEADETAFNILLKNRHKIDLAFNYAIGTGGRDRDAQIPSMLEMLGIPYTNSRPLTYALTADKAKTKEVLIAHGIPTPKYQVYEKPTDKLINNLHFPLIVKPTAQNASAGITNDSLVSSNKALRKQINWVIKTFSQPALVEEFLEGKEFSIPMLGNPPKFLPFIHADHSKLPTQYNPIDSLEVKWLFEESSQVNHLICPAIIPKSLREKIEAICLASWQALEISDCCRIDVRCDKNNKPQILEVNAPPGLLPPEVSQTSYFPLSARVAGIDYEHLIKKILDLAFKRTKLLIDT